jgi:hypothetical protein
MPRIAGKATDRERFRNLRLYSTERRQPPAGAFRTMPVRGVLVYRQIFRLGTVRRRRLLVAGYAKGRQAAGQ